MRTPIKTLLGTSAALLLAMFATTQSASAASLAHNWTFDSDLTDAVGSKDATAFGNAGVSVTSKIGGGAASFDGNGDYLTAGTTSDFVIGTGAMSVSFWFNVADANMQQADRFLSAGAGGSTEDGWSFFMRDNAAGTISDGIDAAVSDGGGRRIQGTNANDTVDSLDGNWHLAVAVFDYNAGNGTIDLYLDSVLESTISLADLGTWNGSSIDNGTVLHFGARNVVSLNEIQNHMNGLLDDVAIWDGALSQSEVSALWNGGAGESAANVPEPGSLALLIAGGLCILRRRRG